MKILITGGSGFVGKSLKEGLNGEFEIFSPGRQELNLLDEVAVEKYILKNKITTVIHAAVHSALAISRQEGFEQDSRMFANLLRNIGHLKKIINFGSGAEFGKTRDLKKIRENQFGEVVPQDSYGLSKYLMNQVARSEPKLLNMRLFGIYGKNENYRYKFITNTIVKHLLNLPITIKQDAIFDYLYIDDLVKIVKYFLTHKHVYQDYNITPTDSVSLKEIVNVIDQVGGKKSALKIVNSGFNFQYTGSNQRLLEEIPEFTFTSIKSGIEQLFQYYRSCFNELDIEAIKKDEFLAKSKVR